MKYQLNMKQYRALQGLAYWVADINYIRERYGKDDPECTICDKTIKLTFDQLDKMQVPYWVQNAVICFAEDWRKYKQTYFQGFLASRNITVA